MTRTKRWLLAALAASLISGVAVAAEAIDIAADDYAPEPTPVVTGPWEGESYVDNEVHFPVSPHATYMTLDGLVFEFSDEDQLVTQVK